MHKLCLLDFTSLSRQHSLLRHIRGSTQTSFLYMTESAGPILLWNHLETTTTQFLILLSFISRNNARPAPCSPSSSLPSCVTPSKLVKTYAYTLWVALLTRGSRSIFFKAWFTCFTELTSAAYDENRFPLSSVCFPSNTFVSILALEASSNSSTYGLLTFSRYTDPLLGNTSLSPLITVVICLSL